MSQRIEIILGGGEILDMSSSVALPLTYQIDDVRNISTSNGNYSKSILIPGTKNNNKQFGFLFDVNSDFSFFNPNLKTTAKLVVDSVTVMNGYMRLNDIKKNFNTDLQGNEIFYEILLFEDFTNFFGDIKDKFLTNNIDSTYDLDFSEFDHELNNTNLLASFSHSWEDGYANFVGYKTVDRYGSSDFKPAIFYKQYLLKIASKYGYEFGGDFMDNSLFEKEIIPYSGDIYVADTVILAEREFYVGLPTAQTGTYTDTFTFNGNEPIISDLQDGIYTDDTTAPWNDSGGNWNTTTSEWVVTESSIYTLSATQSIEVMMETTRDAYQRGTLGGSNITPPALVMEVQAYLNDYPIGTVITNTYINDLGNELIGEKILPNGSSGEALFNAGNSYTLTFETETITKNLLENVLLRADDVITTKYRITTKGIDARYVGENVEFSTDYVDFDITIEPKNVELQNTAETYSFNDGDTVFMNSFLSQNTKVSELFDDLQKRYNLIFRTEPNNSKKILIDTRDDYYSAGEIVDWTDKVDYSNQQIVLLSDLQNKKIDYSYTNDNSFWNKYYTTATNGDTYGMKKIEFTNQFSSGTKKVQSPFAPTSMIYSPEKIMLVPDILTEAPKSKLHVLYFQGLIPTLQGEFSLFDGIQQVTTLATNYPCASHFDDNFNPTIDLNFGANDFYYYDELVATTSNTQYERYWANSIEQITTSRLLLTKMYLNNIDIVKIKNNFNLKIWLKDAYFNINKVIDYNANQQGLTQVELIKTVPFVAWSTNELSTSTPVNRSEKRAITKFIHRTDIVSGLEGGGILQTSHTTISGTAGLTGNQGIIGTGSVDGSLQTQANAGRNQILSPDAIVTGDGNFVAENTSNVIVSGDDNSVQSFTKNAAIIGGSGNTIESGLENVALIGVRDKTITQSNEMWIGEEIQILNGEIIITNQLNATPLIFAGTNSTGMRNIIPDFGDNTISLYQQSDIAAILSGQNNTITTSTTSTGGTIISGKNNTISGGFTNLIGGGESNSITGTGTNNSLILGGNSNIVTKISSAVVASSSCTINHNRCVILGKTSFTTTAQGTTYVDRLEVADGIQTDNVTLKTKVLDIGDWNMETATAGSSTKTVAHGLTFRDIRVINVVFRNDADTLQIAWGIDSTADTTNINMLRATGFNSINYNSTSYNRGWVTITYVA